MFGLMEPIFDGLSGCWTVVCVRHNVINEFGDCSSVLKVDAENISEVSVFPNPTSAVIFVNLHITDSVIFRLRSIQGELVLQSTVTSNNSVISVEHLSPGIYFYEVGSALPQMLIKL